MKRLLASVCVAIGCFFCVGCGPKVAAPEQSEFQGEDLEKQMKAMEAVGNEGGAGTTPVAR